MGRLPIKGEYPKDWRELAKLVKDEAAWCCVRCSHVHDPKAGRCLTVHHFDGDKSNGERWNLMALCQSCHLQIQGRVNPDVPLLMEATPWSMPYIAGFYEAGRGTPGPTYDLATWIEKHGNWPAWAPRPKAEVAA
jgi:hypothetical protein